MLMFITLMITCSMLFMFMKHPLSCGLILLIQTILTTMMTGLMNYNYWYSYILFLIMIGGMLILFIYMTSIASNEKFKFNSKLMILMSLLNLIFLNFYFMDSFYLNLNYQIIEFKSINLINNNLSMIKYFNLPTNLLMMLMIIYLFITLIAIVKITNFTYGPLRQKF